MSRNIFRNSSPLVFALVAIAAAGCSPSTATTSDDAITSSVATPVVNEATVYSRHVAFDKGPGGGGSGNNGNGNGNGGNSCTLPDSLVLDVGTKGGSFSFAGSSFVVPKNAVNTTVHIVMVPQLDSTVAVQFFPEGLVFNANAMPTLTINTDCIGDPSNASIVYTDGSGNVLEHKQTKGKTPNSVSTLLAHFSRYAIAW